VNISAIQASPFHDLAPLEYQTNLEVRQKAAKTSLVLLFGHGGTGYPFSGMTLSPKRDDFQDETPAEFG
jgi:hypothetical protein